MGLFTRLLSLNRLAHRLRFVQNLVNERVTQIVDKDVLKNRFFSNYFMLVTFISTVMFFKIDFAVWNFVGSLKFYHKNNSCQSLLLKSLEIRLFYRKLNNRKRGNLLSVFHRNSPEYGNDQRGKLDWNWLKFYGERNTGLRAITAPSYKQPSKLSQLQNTQLNLLTVTFLAILKWTEINLRWLIVDGCVKRQKIWLTIAANF